MATALPAPREGNISTDVQGRRGSPRAVLIATILGTSMSFIVGSIINVALPAMQREFRMGADGAQLLINAYLLPVSALMLLGGALGKHFGHRRFLSLGLAIFAVGTGACALSPSLDLLIASRALQGVGASLIAPNSLGIIAETFSGGERRRAVSLWATVGAAAGAVGPVAAGWIVDVADWRWAFAAIAPPVVLALALLSRVGAVIASGPDDVPARRAPLDLSGGIAVTVLLAALVFFLIRAPRTGTDAVSIGTAVTAAATLIAFLLIERRAGALAMVPLAIFQSHGFSSASVVTLLLYGSLGGLMVLLPYLLIGSMGYSATAAGAAILPIPAAMVGMSRPITPWLSAVGIGLSLAIGSALVAVGFGLLAVSAKADMTYATDLLPGLVVAGVGMAFSIGMLTPAIASSVRPEQAGVATNVNNATSRIGGLIATAMLGPILTLANGADALLDSYTTACWAGAGLAVAACATTLAFFREAGAPAKGAEQSE